MSPEMIGMLGIVAVLAMILLLKVPPGFAMAITGIVGIMFLASVEAGLNRISSEIWTNFSSYNFTVIPLFILMGVLVFHSGYGDKLFASSHAWFGHFRGGLAVTSVFACSAFSAICGSNTATAATMSAVAIPAMRKYNYHPVLMTGSVAAGSTLGVMIPPSIVLLVYGIYTATNINALFFGVVLPGLILTGLMALTVVLICAIRPQWGPAGERSSWAVRLRSLLGMADIALLFLAVMGVMFTGKIVPTEAAAVGCFLTMVILLARRKLTWKKFQAAMADTLTISCMVFIIIVGATIFGGFIALTRLPFEVVEWIGGQHLSPLTMLALMMLVYAIGGCLMDALAFLLISLPIFMPLVLKMGYDPIWFGVMVCLVTTLGAITPPVGVCCFVIAGMNKDIPMQRVFRGAAYFIPAYLLLGVLLVLFPNLVMWLANMVGR